MQRNCECLIRFLKFFLKYRHKLTKKSRQGFSCQLKYMSESRYIRLHIALDFIRYHSTLTMRGCMAAGNTPVICRSFCPAKPVTKEKKPL